MNKDKCGSRFFQNTECECFPCHQGISKEEFNCLFCYCPLYALGKKCGGHYRYTEKGVKSCKDCAFPHHRKNYDRVIGRFSEIMEAVRRMDGESNEREGTGQETLGRNR